MRLFVVMLDRFRTQVAAMHEQQFLPYGRRLVTIELTAEQASALTPRVVGGSCGAIQREAIGEVWLEQDQDGQPQDAASTDAARTQP